MVAFNNTMQTQVAQNPIHCSPIAPMTFTNENMHFITESASGYNADCSSHGNIFSDTTSLLTNNATATSQGYTSAETFAYSPSAKSAPTVGSGTNENVNCTAMLASSDPLIQTAGTACKFATTYACTYNSSSHTVSCPAETALARPSGAWDIGAYQFTPGAPAPTPPPSVTA